MLEWSNGTDQGELFAIFWGLFNLAAVVGGLATFAYFSRSDVEASAPLYVLFLCLILLGAAATRRLSDGPAARLGSDGRLSMARPPAPAPSPVEVAGGVRAVHQAPSVRLQLACATVSNGAATFDPGVRQADAAGAEPLLGQQQPAWSAACQEARETLSVFGSRRMAILAPFFFYTGFNQPYQLNTFGDRLFSPPTLGLEVVLFYTAEIGGAFGAGWFLDRPFAAATPRRAAALQLLLFTLLTAVGYAFAASLWRDADGNPRLSFPRDGLRLVAPSLAFFLWGLSDSQAQAYAYWLLRRMHSSGTAQARAVGYYKLVQSLGWCVGFALVPAERCPPLVQLVATGTCGMLGALLALCALPPSATQQRAEAEESRPCEERTDGAQI